MRKLLDPKEVADLLGVPQRTLDQWVYLSKGPSFLKIGRHRRYRPEDVEAWLDAHTTSGDAA